MVYQLECVVYMLFLPTRSPDGLYAFIYDKTAAAFTMFVEEYVYAFRYYQKCIVM